MNSSILLFLLIAAAANAVEVTSVFPLTTILNRGQVKESSTYIPSNGANVDLITIDLGEVKELGTFSVPEIKGLAMTGCRGSSCSYGSWDGLNYIEVQTSGNGSDWSTQDTMVSTWAGCDSNQNAEYYNSQGRADSTDNPLTPDVFANYKLACGAEIDLSDAMPARYVKLKLVNANIGGWGEHSLKLVTSKDCPAISGENCYVDRAHKWFEDPFNGSEAKCHWAGAFKLNDANGNDLLDALRQQKHIGLTDPEHCFATQPCFDGDWCHNNGKCISMGYDYDTWEPIGECECTNGSSDPHCKGGSSSPSSSPVVSSEAEQEYYEKRIAHHKNGGDSTGKAKRKALNNTRDKFGDNSWEPASSGGSSSGGSSSGGSSSGGSLKKSPKAKKEGFTTAEQQDYWQNRYEKFIADGDSAAKAKRKATKNATNKFGDPATLELTNPPPAWKKQKYHKRFNTRLQFWLNKGKPAKVAHRKAIEDTESRFPELAGSSSGAFEWNELAFQGTNSNDLEIQEYWYNAYTKYLSEGHDQASAKQRAGWDTGAEFNFV